ncbi:Uncharacterised protein [Mycobacteroides abscessus subsp. abscessus]|nr:Uncharacterised protein [Mycobacteroides abscessus subsp. abscessus]
MPIQQADHRLPGCVETQRPGVRNTQLAAESRRSGPIYTIPVVGEVAHQCGMRADHTLRLSRRSGGEDQVRALIAVYDHRVAGLGTTGDPRGGPGIIEDQDLISPTGNIAMPVDRDDKCGIGLPQNRFNACGG